MTYILSVKKQSDTEQAFWLFNEALGRAERSLVLERKFILKGRGQGVHMAKSVWTYHLDPRFLGTIYLQADMIEREKQALGKFFNLEEFPAGYFYTKKLEEESVYLPKVKNRDAKSDPPEVSVSDSLEEKVKKHE